MNFSYNKNYEKCFPFLKFNYKNGIYVNYNYIKRRLKISACSEIWKMDQVFW